MGTSAYPKARPCEIIDTVSVVNGAVNNVHPSFERLRIVSIRLFGSARWRDKARDEVLVANQDKLITRSTVIFERMILEYKNMLARVCEFWQPSLKRRTHARRQSRIMQVSNPRLEIRDVSNGIIRVVASKWYASREWLIPG